MECPICEAPMMHMGYFRWSCDDCGYSCNGDLPGDQAPAAEEEGAS
jgi:ribosomal protein L37AE/L43A